MKGEIQGIDKGTKWVGLKEENLADALEQERRAVAFWFSTHYWGAASPPPQQDVQHLIEKYPVGWSLFLRHAPLYQIWTGECVQALARYLEDISARVIVEVGAGDGRLIKWLSTCLPSSMALVASDNSSWSRVQEYRVGEVAALPYPDAIQRFTPDTVISSWMPTPKIGLLTFGQPPSCSVTY